LSRRVASPWQHVGDSEFAAALAIMRAMEQDLRALTKA